MQNKNIIVNHRPTTRRTSSTYI